MSTKKEKDCGLPWNQVANNFENGVTTERSFTYMVTRCLNTLGDTRLHRVASCDMDSGCETYALGVVEKRFDAKSNCGY